MMTGMKTLWKMWLLILACLSLQAAPPAISKIALTDVTHSSVRVCFDVSPSSAYVQAKIGTVSGTYVAQASKSYQASNDSGGGHACLAFGGLADSTTYYVLPMARPNKDDDIDICNFAECGAMERSFTTGSATAPVVPTPPKAYAVPNIDTSAYTIIRMIRGGSGQCVAATNVGPVTYGNGSWSITAGDAVQAVLNKVGYGTVLEFDQGITCDVPGTGTYHSGYTLTHHAVDPTASGIDDPRHRWIILRTKTLNPADFPPFGSRTSPAFAVKSATFKALIKETGSLYSLGQVFEGDSAGGSQHYIIQNLTLTVNQTASPGPWGEILSFGNGTGADTMGDYLVLDRCLVRGSAISTVDTVRGIHLAAKRVALVGNWIDQIWAASAFAQGIFGDPGGTGPYLIDNNHIEAIGMGIYQEANNGWPAPANDVTITHNTLYWPLAKKDNGYLVRQQVEFKGGRRILIQGNVIDGCWVYQNECPSIFVSGTNNYQLNSGISDVKVDSNLIRNVATVFDCFGVRPADNNPAADNPISQRLWFSNNLAYNLGYANHVAAGAPGGGLINAYFSLRPGCADVTVTQNTFGFSNPQDTRSGSMIGFVPVLYSVGGGATLASGFTHTNNVLYVSVGALPYRGRIFADDPHVIASHPRTPAVDISGSPKRIMDSYAVTSTNAGTTPSYTWSGNVNICGKINAGGNKWSDMSGATCSTYQAGMPGTDKWPTGSSMAAREASVGLNTTTWNCSKCGGAGVNTAVLYANMGLVTEVLAPSASATAVQFQYTAPDARACAVDISPDGTTWARTADAGGAPSRSITISGLAASRTYSYRILCYFSQTAPLFFGSQITDGHFTTSNP